MKIKIIQLLLFISIINFSAQANFSNFSNFDNDFTDYENLGSKKSNAIIFEDFDGKEHKIITDFELTPNINIQKLPVFAKDKSNYCLAITDANYTGYLYEYNIITNTLEKEILYQNEPTWTRTFFGKTQNGNPVLYHIDNETNFIYQSYKKDGKWKLHRTFSLTDRQLDSLFSELSTRSSSENPNVFDIDMNIEDPYFQFLEWKAELKGNPKYYKEGAIHYPKNGEDGPFYIPECWKTQKTTESDVIEIQNMPPVKTQNTMGECRAFSLAVLIQKFICENSKNADGSKRYIDCSNPPPDKAISYFGMMAYTNSINANLKSLQPHQKNQLRVDGIVKKITDDGEGFIFESCKPFDKLANNFSFYNNRGDKGAEEFLKYTHDLYNRKKAITEAIAVEDCPECLKQLSNMTGFDENVINLKQALTKKSYDEFLYTLFFADCKLKDVTRGFRQVKFPQDDMAMTNDELKQKIKEGLTKGHPVLFPNLCMNRLQNGKCVEAHSVVISGYKKIFCNSKFIDSFKIHNSWGIEWQKLNNDGWISANELLDKTQWDSTSEGTKNRKILRGSVIWLE